MKAFLSNIAKRENNEGHQTFTILYTDEINQKFVKDYSRVFFDLAILKQTARGEINRLESEPPITDLTDITIGMEIDVTLPPSIPPTPEQIAQSDFLRTWGLYQSMLRAIGAELLAPDDKTVKDAHDFLIVKFLPGYVEFM